MFLCHYVLCTAVNVVYHCTCCVPVCSVLPFYIQLSSYHCVLRLLQCLCCVQYSIFCIYCALFCCTTNQCATHNISLHYPHNTCTTTGCATTVGWLLIMTTVARGCATTVGWLLIMTTVGKAHAVKYMHQRSNTD